MRKLSYRIFGIALAAVVATLILLQPATVAQAQRGPIHNYRKIPTPVLAKADTTTTRSFTIPSVTGYGIAIVYLWHADHASLSRVYMDCTGKYDTRDYEIQDCTLAFGDCASNSARWHTQATITGAYLWPWRIDVMGYERVDCVLTFTGGSANDSIEVDGAMMTQ